MSDSLLQSWFERCCEQLPDLRAAAVVDRDGAVLVYGGSKSADSVQSIIAAGQLALVQKSTITSVAQGEPPSVVLACALTDHYPNCALALQFSRDLDNHQRSQSQLEMAISWLDWAVGESSLAEVDKDSLPNWLAALLTSDPACDSVEVLGALEARLGAESVYCLNRSGNRWRMETISGARDFDDQSPAVVDLIVSVDNTELVNDQTDFCGSIDNSDDPNSSATPQFFASISYSEEKSVAASRARRIVATFKSEAEAEHALEHLTAIKAALYHLLPSAKTTHAHNRLVDRFSWLKFASISGRLKLGGALVVLLFMMLPVDHSVKADAIIEGAIHRAVVSPFEGYIESSAVRAGDEVKEGQVLASLEDRALKLELDGLETRLRELDRTYRQALSQLKHAKSQIVQAQMAQVSADVNLLKDRLSRAQLTAPISGVVISGDLSRVLGSPVERGQVLFEIAPLESYRARLSVHQQDIYFVEKAQSGRITLVALPNNPLSIRVGNIVPVFNATQPDSAFQVEGLLTFSNGSSESQTSVDMLRPGMKGIAKLEVGQKALGWVLFHDLIHWWQIKVWGWLP